MSFDDRYLQHIAKRISENLQDKKCLDAVIVSGCTRDLSPLRLLFLRLLLAEVFIAGKNPERSSFNVISGAIYTILSTIASDRDEPASSCVCMLCVSETGIPWQRIADMLLECVRYCPKDDPKCPE